MKRKNAFTLIELLVVIAIIAILAAILFPVFAQAKAAAKKSASISNAKQTSLATIMYAGDYDDVNVVAINWSTDGAPVLYGGAGYQPWSWLVQPYQKNTDINQDPQAPPNEAWPAAFGTTAPKAIHPQYGYNYVYMSPLIGASPTTSTFAPVSSTSLAAPADTVLLASKFSSAEDSLTATGIYWYGAGSITTTIGVEVPHCATIVQWCFDNWGDNGFYSDTYLNNNEAAGAFTGGMSLRHGKQAVVAWADGHVSSRSAGQMAAGTNWTPTIDSANTVVIDSTKYLWDIE